MDSKIQCSECATILNEKNKKIKELEEEIVLLKLQKCDNDWYKHAEDMQTNFDTPDVELGSNIHPYTHAEDVESKPRQHYSMWNTQGLNDCTINTAQVVPCSVNESYLNKRFEIL